MFRQNRAVIENKMRVLKIYWELFTVDMRLMIRNKKS